MVIAIDGPSGTGKSSAAKGVARRLGFAYLDTGAMYRAAAILHHRGEFGDDPQATVEALSNSAMNVTIEPDDFRIFLNEEDVTETIRRPEVSAFVSDVATMIPVREYLGALQRYVIDTHEWGIVVEGRDITTVIAPDADVRVLMVADPEVRMRRRRLQLASNEEPAIDDADLEDQVVRRDRDDSTVANFETPAPGVTLIDTTDLDLDEVIDRLCDLVPEHPQE